MQLMLLWVKIWKHFIVKLKTILYLNFSVTLFFMVMGG